MVLSRVDVSYAYPLLSVGYIVTAFVQDGFSLTRSWGLYAGQAY